MARVPVRDGGSAGRCGRRMTAENGGGARVGRGGVRWAGERAGGRVGRRGRGARLRAPQKSRTAASCIVKSSSSMITTCRAAQRRPAGWGEGLRGFERARARTDRTSPAEGRQRTAAGCLPPGLLAPLPRAVWPPRSCAPHLAVDAVTVRDFPHRRRRRAGNTVPAVCGMAAAVVGAGGRAGNRARARWSWQGSRRATRRPTAGTPVWAAAAAAAPRAPGQPTGVHTGRRTRKRGWAWRAFCSVALRPPRHRRPHRCSAATAGTAAHGSSTARWAVSAAEVRTETLRNRYAQEMRSLRADASKATDRPGRQRGGGEGGSGGLLLLARHWRRLRRRRRPGLWPRRPGVRGAAAGRAAPLWWPAARQKRSRWPSGRCTEMKRSDPDQQVGGRGSSANCCRWRTSPRDVRPSPPPRADHKDYGCCLPPFPTSSLPSLPSPPASLRLSPLLPALPPEQRCAPCRRRRAARPPSRRAARPATAGHRNPAPQTAASVTRARQHSHSVNCSAVNDTPRHRRRGRDRRLRREPPPPPQLAAAPATLEVRGRAAAGRSHGGRRSSWWRPPRSSQSTPAVISACCPLLPPPTPPPELPAASSACRLRSRCRHSRNNAVGVFSRAHEIMTLSGGQGWPARPACQAEAGSAAERRRVLPSRRRTHLQLQHAGTAAAASLDLRADKPASERAGGRAGGRTTGSRHSVGAAKRSDLPAYFGAQTGMLGGRGHLLQPELGDVSTSSSSRSSTVACPGGGWGGEEAGRWGRGGEGERGPGREKQAYSGRR